MIKIIIIFLILICLISIFTSNDEPMENMTQLSNEALQDIGSVYNDRAFTANDIAGTKSIKANENLFISADPNYQDRLVVYKDGNGKPPYLYYNKHGQLGMLNDTTVSFSVNADGTISAKGRDLLNELTHLRNDLTNLRNDFTNLQNNVNNNYIKKGSYISVVRSFCDSGACGDKKYLNLNNLPLVTSSSGGGYDKLVIVQ